MAEDLQLQTLYETTDKINKIMQAEENYIPEEGYLFFPTHEDRWNTNGMRWMFDGPIQLEEHEKTAIQKFRVYCDKNKYVLKHMWTENLLIRFLQACAFKMDKTLTCVREHTIWRETKLPMKLTPEIEQFLNSGILYVHGRDNRLRPIVVFNAYLVDPKEFKVDLMIDGLTYMFEVIINTMMLPGQIENWIFIMDL